MLFCLQKAFYHAKHSVPIVELLVGFKTFYSQIVKSKTVWFQNKISRGTLSFYKTVL
jgi:hypothetical protein